MKNLPIGRHDFASIRRADRLYVDKTEIICRMLVDGDRWFLSRPRRFGKSLTVTTLKAIFSGQKELFEGLWIEDKIEWESFPVLFFSFDMISSRELPARHLLLQQIDGMAASNDIVLEGDGMKERLRELIQNLSNTKQVVVLVDEYDKPILDAVPDQMDVAEDRRLLLKEFFETLKNLDAHLRFVFVTGVAKFAKTGMFSGANQLVDMTFNPDFATLCGYTQAELEHHFSETFPPIAERMQLAPEQVLAEIKKWYNGYAWRGESVYNPWSILNMAATNIIDNYWFTSGNPEFLIKILKRGLYYKLPNLTVNKTALESFDLENIEYRTLLFQAGYLTIKSENVRERTFTLGFPNFEIEESLLQHLLGAYSETNASDAGISALDLRDALMAHDLKQVVRILNSLFASIPYQIFLAKYEAYFHSILHIAFSMLGFYVKSEASTAEGRADSVVTFPDKVYVFEFKLDDTAQAALTQIDDNGYAAPFRASGKRVICVGFSFSSKDKKIVDFKVKEVG